MDQWQFQLMDAIPDSADTPTHLDVFPRALAAVACSEPVDGCTLGCLTFTDCFISIDFRSAGIEELCDT